MRATVLTCLDFPRDFDMFLQISSAMDTPKVANLHQPPTSAKSDLNSESNTSSRQFQPDSLKSHKPSNSHTNSYENQQKYQHSSRIHNSPANSPSNSLQSPRRKSHPKSSIPSSSLQSHTNHEMIESPYSPQKSTNNTSKPSHKSFDHQIDQYGSIIFSHQSRDYSELSETTHQFDNAPETLTFSHPYTVQFENMMNNSFEPQSSKKQPNSSSIRDNLYQSQQTALERTEFTDQSYTALLSTIPRSQQSHNDSKIYQKSFDNEVTLTRSSLNAAEDFLKSHNESISITRQIYDKSNISQFPTAPITQERSGASTPPSTIALNIHESPKYNVHSRIPNPHHSQTKSSTISNSLQSKTQNDLSSTMHKAVLESGQLSHQSTAAPVNLSFSKQSSFDKNSNSCEPNIPRSSPLTLSSTQSPKHITLPMSSFRQSLKLPCSDSSGVTHQSHIVSKDIIPTSRQSPEQDIAPASNISRSQLPCAEHAIADGAYQYNIDSAIQKLPQQFKTEPISIHHHTPNIPKSSPTSIVVNTRQSARRMSITSKPIIPTSLQYQTIPEAAQFRNTAETGQFAQQLHNTAIQTSHQIQAVPVSAQFAHQPYTATLQTSQQPQAALANAQFSHLPSTANSSNTHQTHTSPESAPISHQSYTAAFPNSQQPQNMNYTPPFVIIPNTYQPIQSHSASTVSSHQANIVAIPNTHQSNTASINTQLTHQSLVNSQVAQQVHAGALQTSHTNSLNSRVLSQKSHTKSLNSQILSLQIQASLENAQLAYQYQSLDNGSSNQSHTSLENAQVSHQYQPVGHASSNLSHTSLENSQLSYQSHPANQTSYRPADTSQHSESSSPEYPLLSPVARAPSASPDFPDLMFSVLVPAPRQLTLERQLNKSVLIGWTAPEPHTQAPAQIDSYHVYVDGVLKTTVKATERTRALVEGVDSNRVSNTNYSLILTPFPVLLCLERVLPGVFE